MGNRVRYLKDFQYLTIDEWKKLESLAKEQRDDLITQLLYESGCTVNELVNIRKADISDNSLHIRPKNARNKEGRHVYISNILVKKIAAFSKANPGSIYLFSTRQSPQMTTKRVRQIVQGLCKKIGVDAGPQVLRYTHIVHAYQKKIPLMAIQKQVGLKRSRAIEIFNQLPDMTAGDAYKNFI